MNALDLIKKVGEKENSITLMEFVSPIFHNTRVATRVCGIVYYFDVPSVKPGWYTIRPKNNRAAVIVGEATLPDIDKYLRNLDRVRVTLAMKDKDVYYGVPGKIWDTKGAVKGKPVPVFLFDDSVQDFDRVICCTDSMNFWYQGPDPSNNPAKAEYLRTSMQKLVEPDKIKFTDLLFDEKAAYAFRLSIDKKLKEELKKKGVQADIEHAGGKFLRSVERSDHISVTYMVDGDKYTSYVSKDPTHKIITAGVCLAGTDNLFDLKSLVTVLREGQRRDLIHRTNNTR